MIELFHAAGAEKTGKIVRWSAAVGLAAGLLAGSGCVHRRMTIRSNPPGAQVFIDKTEVGQTPVSTEFQYYGTREIQLVKDGYETLTVKQTLYPPWYEFPVLEFFSENLSLHEHRDDHLINLQMVPQQISPVERVVESAEALRLSARQGVAPELPAMPSGTSVELLPTVQPDPILPPAAPTPSSSAPSAILPLPGASLVPPPES